MNLTPIPGFEGLYSITESGMVFSHAKGKFRALSMGSTYFQVTLNKGGKKSSWSIHRLMSRTFFGGAMLDHKDRNPLNNNKANLRPCTHQQNIFNCRKRSDNTSGLRGVSWSKERKKWHAQITFNGKCVALGRYETRNEAAEAYNLKAKELFGEFAVLNTYDEVAQTA